MTERTVIDLLALKLSGEATSADLAALEKLIEKNPDGIYHQELLQQIFVNKADDTDLKSHYNRHRLKYQNKLIFSEEGNLNISSFKESKTLVLACSMFFMLCIIAFFIYKDNTSPVTMFNAAVTTGNAIRKNIVLPDGTKVSLNAHSKIIYDKDMNKRSIRAVKLIGEAFFDVSHNAKRPFIISTNTISIKVLGTAFNVKAYPRDKETAATLLRGSIELSVNNSTKEKIVLKPLEKFELVNQTSQAKVMTKVEKVLPVHVAGKDYTEEVAWIDNRLVFSSETFDNLAPKLEKRFHIKLDIKNQNLKDYHFTGVFTNENLVETLTAMQLIKHFNFKIEGYDVKIY
jgi:transmembrane sensor